MNQFVFYLSYAFRNIRRGGRWTTLAIFCIAAGVATIVSLRSLGLSIGDSLTGTIRQDNKGDIRINKRNGGGDDFASFFTYSEDAPSFTDRDMERISQWVTERGGTMTAFVRGGSFQVTKLDETGVGRPQFLSAYMIDPATYPPTHTITALEPAGVPLANLYTDGNDIVISENLAQSQNFHLGDSVRISGTEEIFTVTGIVATSHEAGLRDTFGAFFGFVYLDIADARRILGEGIDPNNIAIMLPEPLNDASADRAESELRGIVDRVSIQTAPELLRSYENVSQIISDFIVVLGLGALLIGGVGIMNTMLVMVRRRTIEIAALKTFGLKGRQVAAMFLAEGLVLGFAGSTAGGVIGVLLSGIVNRYGETFLQQALPWRLYPEALVYGFGLGMIVTVIFGTAPILTALQIRPGTILRPNDTPLPRMGILQSLLLMIVVTLAIGLIVGQIVQPSFALSERISPEAPYIAGIIGVAGTLLFLGLMTGFLWVIVWLIGTLPAFGSVDLHLALRNLSTNRLRTATTLLALCAGMFALSSITFVGEGTRELLNLQLSQQFGGNVLVFPLAPGGLSSVGEFAIDNALRDVEGITYRTTLNFYADNVELIAVDGIPIEDVVAQLPPELQQSVMPDAPSTMGGSTNEGSNANEGGSQDTGENNFRPRQMVRSIVDDWSTVTVWDSENPAVYAGSIIAAGRSLTPEDRGQPVMVAPLENATTLNIALGSQLTYRVNGQTYDFEIVGLTNQTMSFSSAGITLPPDVLPTAPTFQLYAFQVEQAHVNEALVSLSTIRIPPTFALDVTFIDSLISRFITQFAAIPTIVGLLSLLAAAVIMANTVALGTLERRRQIGILKSVGLKSRRVLVIMLIETTLVGLLSAVLGIGLSSIFVALFTGLSGTPIPLPRDARLVALALVIAAVAIGWLATFLSAGVAVRERVMNVLRYE